MIRDMADLGDVPLPRLTNFSNGLAEVIINHLKANAELDNAKFSGTFAGTVTGLTCSTTISNQTVTGGIK